MKTGSGFAAQPGGLGEFVRGKLNLYLMLALVVGCLLIYGQTAGFDFINIDDGKYVYENTVVQNGLSWEGIKWAFTTLTEGNWHPLTWVSFLTQITLLGNKPGAFHLVNVLFHAANSVLLYVVLKTLTGSTWRSAIVSGLFAFHPAHVESVVWVAERKDVLSAFFWILSTYCYIRYAQFAAKRMESDMPSGRQSQRPMYLLAILMMALGVMAKPMIVTLPFALLLLDYWPLERLKKFNAANIVPLLVEKTPFFVLSAVSCVITVIAQKAGDAIVPLVNVSLSERLANALVSYAKYTGMLFYPVDLALVYEYQGEVPAWQVAGATAFLAIVSIGTVWQVRKRKYLFTGWFWFLGTLIPVIGLVQVGIQAMADRYTYIPFVGLSIMAIWLLTDLLKNLGHKLLVGAACGILIVYSGLAYRQVSWWKNSESLYRRTIAVTSNNAFVEQHLCLDLVGQGRLDEAEAECQRAVALRPALNGPYKLLGFIYLQRQNYAEAAKYLGLALKRKPKDFAAYSTLAKALLVEGRLDEAAEATNKMRSVITLDQVTREGLFQHYTVLAVRYAEKSDYEKAAVYFGKALELNAADADLRSNLGLMLYRAGKKEQGIHQIEESIRQNPGKPEPYNMLGVILSDQGKRAEAIKQFEAAIALKPDFAPALNNLQKIQSGK